MKIPKRPCRWRGWVDLKIIDRQRTDIENSGLKYFALLDVASSKSNSWQPFEMHTGTGKRASEVARLLGHDFKSRKAELQLTPFLRHEKFSDAKHTKLVVGVHPDFDTRTFLEEEDTGDENEEEDTEDEREDSEASRLSTAREEIGNQSPGPEATNMQVYNACNFLCLWTKTKPNARYA
jgi:hypothetical protein